MTKDNNKTIKTEKLIEIISNDEMCKKLNKFEENIDTFGSEFTKEDYLKEINKYIKKIEDEMIKDFHPEYFSILKIYINNFVNKENREEMFFNPVVLDLCNIIHDDGEFFKELIDYVNEIKYIEIRKELCEKFDSYIENDSEIDKETLNKMILFYAKSNIYTELPFGHCNYIIKQILNHYLEEDFEPISLGYIFSKLAEALTKKSGKEINCQIVPEKYFKKILNPITKKYEVTNVKYELKESLLKINKGSISTKMINNIELLENLFHECMKAIQYNNLEKRIPDFRDLKMLKDDILYKKLGIQNYITNYYHISYECDSRLKSRIYLYRYFKAVCPKLADKIIEEAKDTLNKTFTKEDNNKNEGIITSLDELFENAFENDMESKKKIINEFQVFKYEYHEDGTRKTTAKLLNDKYEALANYLEAKDNYYSAKGIANKNLNLYKEKVEETARELKMYDDLIEGRNLSVLEVVKDYLALIKFEPTDEQMKQEISMLLTKELPKKLIRSGLKIPVEVLEATKTKSISKYVSAINIKRIKFGEKQKIDDFLEEEQYYYSIYNSLAILEQTFDYLIKLNKDI